VEPSPPNNPDIINPLIFRAYDIRGLSGTDITDEVAELVGRAYGSYINRDGGRVVVVGRDGRVSSPSIHKSLVRGITAAGVDVIDIGLSTSPMVYFATAYWRLDGGVNVTASHNPPEYNGFKLNLKGGRPLVEEEITQIRDMAQKRDFVEGKGQVYSREVKGDYYQKLLSLVKVGLGLRVVIDAGNGTAGPFAPGLLRQTGNEIIELYCDLDPTFPHHIPDPSIAENLVDLQAEVKETGANLGFAYDGDGDRIGIVDEKGQAINGDLGLVLLARDLLTRHPGAKILFEVRFSQVVIDDIKAHGGQPEMYKCGHSLIRKKMQEEGILLAGELSGHFYFGENYYGIDDSFLASLKIMEIVSRSQKPLSQFFEGLPKLVATPELRIPCDETKKFEVVEQATDFFRRHYPVIDIDGVRINFGDGWGLIRASNTGPLLSLRFEAKSQARLDEIKGIVSAKLADLGCPVG
jgi:phosphomannomutase/phosphoglucomutase